MPAVLLDLNAFTQLAIRSGVAGYSGPGQSVTYSIDLEAYSDWLGTEMKEQGSFAPVMLHLPAGKQLPSPDDILRVLEMGWYALEPQTSKLVTVLAVSNASGYDHDARSHKWDYDYEQQRMCTASPAERGSFQQHAYTPCCVKVRPSGITLQDYVDAVFQVKSGKRDIWYESLASGSLGCKVEAAGIAGTLKLCIDLVFDHGS